MITEYTTIKDIISPVPAPEVKESRLLKALVLLMCIIIFAVPVVPIYGAPLIMIATMLMVVTVVYHNYLQSSYLKERPYIVLETVHHKDRVWREQRGIQSIEPLTADIEIPEAKKMHGYAVADDDGLTYYLSPIPWDQIIRGRQEIDTAGGTVEGMAALIHTQVVGAQYDPDSDEIIPVKRILNTQPTMTASGESVVGVYDAVQYNDYEASLTNALQDQLMNEMTIRKERDHQLHALLIDEDLKALKFDKKAQALGDQEFAKAFGYSSGAVSTGWARINVTPPKPKVIRKDEVSIGYKCFHCNATLKDTNAIARNGDIGLHFICAYCGAVNQVQEVAR